MNRFGKISPPTQNFEPTLANFYGAWQIVSKVNGQILKTIHAIWSHCVRGVQKKSRNIRIRFQVIAFVYFFYQLQAISLMCSMITTVVLAVERFLAVTKPMEYHFAVVAAANQPWHRVMRYMVPTVVFCVVFNLPKFFELVIFQRLIR